MTARVFVDTNVFIYAGQIDEPLKQPVAQNWLERLWEERSGHTSTQVLNEYYWNVTRKIRPALSPDEAWVRVQRLFPWHPQPIDTDVLRQGREIQRRYGLSWWDSLIVGAAQVQSCVLLLTEDLQDRAIFGGVTIRNPFTLGISEAAIEYGAAPTAVRPHRSRGRPKRAKRTVAA